MKTLFVGGLFSKTSYLLTNHRIIVYKELYGNIKLYYKITVTWYSFPGLKVNFHYISLHYTGRKAVESANYKEEHTKAALSYSTTGRVRYVDVKDNILYYTQQGPNR